MHVCLILEAVIEKRLESQFSVPQFFVFFLLFFRLSSLELDMTSPSSDVTGNVVGDWMCCAARAFGEFVNQEKETGV